MTFNAYRCNVFNWYRKIHRVYFLLFRAVEIQRICEAAATPVIREGANLSEQSNNKRIGL